MKVNITPIVLLIILDIFKLNTLWNERFTRRILHHINSSHDMNKKPEIYIIKNLISNNNIRIINSFPFKDRDSLSTKSYYMSRLFSGQYSKRSALYYNDFNKITQLKLDYIGNQIKYILESKIKKKLTLGRSDFRAIILRYEGKNASFNWHYDTEPSNCYRVLALIKRRGTIPPFMYYDKNKNIQKVNLDLGDAIFFKGTKTYHAVDKSNDPNTVRYLVGFQYYTGTYKPINSLCDNLRGATTLNSFITFLPNIVLINIIVYIGYKYKIDVPYVLHISSLLLLFSYLFSTKMPKNIGTGQKYTLLTIIKLILILSIITVNYKVSIPFASYIIFTETIFPKSIVYKSLEYRDIE
tara:strand:+ start:1984 stop:3042 length:1059 start_codon:yes stop_codon:yes gene_type:complete